jgi:hypothetical protein
VFGLSYELRRSSGYRLLEETIQLLPRGRSYGSLRLGEGSTLSSAFLLWEHNNKLMAVPVGSH